MLVASFLLWWPGFVLVLARGEKPVVVLRVCPWLVVTGRGVCCVGSLAGWSIVIVISDDVRSDGFMISAHLLDGVGPLYERCSAGEGGDCPVAGRDGVPHGSVCMSFDSVAALVQYDVIVLTGSWGELYARHVLALRHGHAIDVGAFAEAVRLGLVARYETARVGMVDVPPFGRDDVEDMLRGLTARVRGDTIARLARCVLPVGTLTGMPPEIIREDLADAIASGGGCTVEDADAILDAVDGDTGLDLTHGAMILANSEPRLALGAARALASRYGLDVDAGACSTVTAEDEAAYRARVHERACYVAGRVASFADADAVALRMASGAAEYWVRIIDAYDDGDDDAMRRAVRDYAAALRGCGGAGAAGAVKVPAAPTDVWGEYARLMHEGRYGEAIRVIARWLDDDDDLDVWDDFHRFSLPSSDESLRISSCPGFPLAEDQALARAGIEAMDRINAMMDNGPLMRIATGTDQPRDDYRNALAVESYDSLCDAIGEPHDPMSDENYTVYGRYALTRGPDGSIIVDQDGHRCCERWLNAVTTDPSMAGQVLKGEDWMFDEEDGVTMEDERIRIGTSGWEWDRIAALTSLIQYPGQ